MGGRSTQHCKNLSPRLVGSSGCSSSLLKPMKADEADDTRHELELAHDAFSSLPSIDIDRRDGAMNAGPLLMPACPSADLQSVKLLRSEMHRAFGRCRRFSEPTATRLSTLTRSSTCGLEAHVVPLCGDRVVCVGQSQKMPTRVWIDGVGIVGRRIDGTDFITLHSSHTSPAHISKPEAGAESHARTKKQQAGKASKPRRFAVEEGRHRQRRWARVLRRRCVEGSSCDGWWLDSGMVWCHTIGLFSPAEIDSHARCIESGIRLDAASHPVQRTTHPHTATPSTHEKDERGRRRQRRQPAHLAAEPFTRSLWRWGAAEPGGQRGLPGRGQEGRAGAGALAVLCVVPCLLRVCVCVNFGVCCASSGFCVLLCSTYTFMSLPGWGGVVDNWKQ